MLVSSPREWGCLWVQDVWHVFPDVFPTRVGVSPKSSYFAPRGRGLPHASGGVPTPELLEAKREMSSPREWGCPLPERSGSGKGAFLT